MKDNDGEFVARSRWRTNLVKDNDGICSTISMADELSEG